MYEIRYKSHHDASSRALKQHFMSQMPKEDYLDQLLHREAERERALYVHVPFCNKVCSFCPFNKPNNIRRRDYHKYVIEQIEQQSGFAYMQKPIRAVNFGGGTPTALEPEQMAAILENIHTHFHLAEDVEISVESSITEMTEEMLSALADNGINRLSFGVQTFDNDTRRLLNRRGSGEQAIETIQRVKRRISNVGIDLIHNYPGQTLKQLESDLKTIQELDLAGISFYSLMIHEGTPLAKKLSDSQKQQMADLDNELQQFNLIVDTLRQDGYEIFELTKLIKQSRDRYEYVRTRHNIGDCIAIGYGAGGNIGNYIYRNAHDFQPVSEDIPISHMGRIVSDAYFVLDKFVNDLQKQRVSFDYYENALQMDIRACLMPLIARLEQEKLVVSSKEGISFTQLGVFYGNNIIDELVQLLVAK